MKSSSHALIVLLAVVGVGALVWLARSRSTVPSALEPNRVLVDATSAETTLATTEARRSESERALVAHDSTKSGSHGTATSAGDPDAVGAWSVKVVNTDASPRAGAVVRWATGVGFEQMRDASRPFWKQDPERWIAADAPQLVTGDDGFVHLPRSALPGAVVATHEGRMGWTIVDVRRPQGIVLRLDRVYDLKLRVLDADGKPVAGAPVAIRSQSVPMNQALWTGITEGPDGIAHARDLERHLHTVNGMPTDLLAWLPMTSRSAVIVPIDLENVPAEPIDLVLPPCGSVELRLRDQNGAPARADRVQLAHSTQLNKAGKIGYNGVEFECATLEPGRAVFPFVELGLDLYAEAQIAFDSPSVRGPGPTRNGERVTFDLDLGAPRPRVVGRIVREDGSAVAGAVLNGSLQVKIKNNLSGSYGMSLGRTDDDGAFAFDLPCRVVDGIGLHLQVQFTNADASGYERVDADAPTPLRPDVVDLGALVVREPDTIAEGRVVDEDGTALEGVLFGVSVPAPPGSPPDSWTDDVRVRIAAGATASAFRVQTTGPRERMRIRAMKRGYVQAVPCEVVPGARDVTLVLTRSATIAGRVLVDTSEERRRLRVAVVRPTDDDATRRAFRHTEERAVRDDGTFVFEDLRRGTVDVELRVIGSKTPILTLRDVDLRAPGAATDRRLEQVDVRGLVPDAPAPPRANGTR